MVVLSLGPVDKPTLSTRGWPERSCLLLHPAELRTVGAKIVGDTRAMRLAFLCVSSRFRLRLARSQHFAVAARRQKHSAFSRKKLSF